MIKKFVIIIFVFELFTACGFTPTLKVSNYENNNLIIYEINSGNSYEAKQALKSIITNQDSDNANFLIKIDVIEKESAVNILSSGAVSEYRIEVLINYEIFNFKTNDLIDKSMSRGFANYDISSSEYNNTLSREEALKQALSDGMRLMNIIVQSKIN